MECLYRRSLYARSQQQQKPTLVLCGVFSQYLLTPFLTFKPGCYYRSPSSLVT